MENYQNILPLILAIIAIVPTILSLITQASKDKKQNTIDMNKEAANSLVAVIQPLRDELTRLQARGIELENDLIEKTTENGQLRIQLIDKDTELRTLKYNNDGLKMKLDALQKKNLVSGRASTRKVKKEDTLPLEIKNEIIASEEMKAQIAQETDEVLNDIKNKSISNGTTKKEE